MNKIAEFAVSRADAITTCMSDGRQFMQHFVKVLHDGIDGDNFKHHCHEMQNWFDVAKGIKLKGSKKPLSLEQWMDWFFTAGGNIEDEINEQYTDLYEKLIFQLMSNKNGKIEDIMKQILNSKQYNSV